MELADSKKEDDSKQPLSKYKSAAINALISSLSSLESQRFYPLRLKPFFDLAATNGGGNNNNDLPGPSLDERADWFVKKARENPPWAYDILIRYVNHGKQTGFAEGFDEATRTTVKEAGF